jgi:hypothetical protein
LFERSELSEASAEKKNSGTASEVGGQSPSRSKVERIDVKMERSDNSGERRIERDSKIRAVWVENGRILLLKAKVYSCGSRARGLTYGVFLF